VISVAALLELAVFQPSPKGMPGGDGAIARPSAVRRRHQLARHPLVACAACRGGGLALRLDRMAGRV